MDMQYKDQELIDRVLTIGGAFVPDKYLIIGVQNQADGFNKFDDKFYVFLGKQFVLATTGTTNAGRNALLDIGGHTHEDGAAVWKTDMYYEDLYGYGMHRGKLPCLRQKEPVFFYRDNDGDKKAEEQGKLYEGIQHFNFHGCDYDLGSKKVGTNIGGWSYGCQVCNNMPDYWRIIDLVKSHPLRANYALLKQF